MAIRTNDEILRELYRAWCQITVLSPTFDEFMRIVNTCILEVRAKLIAGQKSSHCSTGSIYVIGHMVDYDEKKPFRYEVMVTACHNIEGE